MTLRPSARVRPVVVTLALLAALLALPLALAPRAEAFIYWKPDYHRTRSGAPTSTARASTRASSPQRGRAGAMAVDGAHIYWINPDSGTIGRANLDGTGVDQSFITGAAPPVSVAVDAAHVYWTDAGPTPSGAPTSTARASTRASSPTS